ncbi:hypothetical protein HGRIS_006627 [Hohenbuehelia grisea]|uniref:Anaphase-promoting complex subunit 1 n=1 Tax=Hohenbuehelia grisea TaxID=104357 RepID=A0ABR3J9T8_9AGAR
MPLNDSAKLNIPIQPLLSPLSYFDKASDASTSTNESELLKAIRVALRGTGADELSKVHLSQSAIASDHPWEARQLSWNADTVIVSRSGVIQRKWSFGEEGQPVQWACFGRLDQSGLTLTSAMQSAAHYTSDSPSLVEQANDRPTFGPFDREKTAVKPIEDKESCVPGVFIFLRSTARIYLNNGIEYSFSLPVNVRKAWPLHPHGVLVQRVLEPSELEEAKFTGEPPLPTIFSITSPFAEASAVGLTNGIIGGYHGAPSILKDEDEASTKPLKSIPSTEMIVWASSRAPEADDDVVVTIDAESGRLSIWRYAYFKPKNVPVPLGRDQVRHARTRKRQSMATHSRVPSTSVFSDVVDRRDPLEQPKSPLVGSLSPQREFTELPGMPSLSELPKMAPSLTNTLTMESLMQGGSSQSQWSMPTGSRRDDSFVRSDVSMTMERMEMGAGRMDLDPSLAPIQHGRMTAAYWMERIHSREVPAGDANSWQNVSVALFDHRWDGIKERSLLAITFPVSQTTLIFSLASGDDQLLKASPLSSTSAVKAVPIRASRDHIWDLLVLKPDGRLAFLMHGTRELAINLVRHWKNLQKDSSEPDPTTAYGKLLDISEAVHSSAILTFERGRFTASFDVVPKDMLTRRCFEVLSFALPEQASWHLHRLFLWWWSMHRYRTSNGVEFGCFDMALSDLLGTDRPSIIVPRLSQWANLAKSPTHKRFREDPVMKLLKGPPAIPHPAPKSELNKPHNLLAPVLCALHILGEDLRLTVDQYPSVVRLCPVICSIGDIIRPEWADFWRRLCPNLPEPWPVPAAAPIDRLDDRIPAWPPDVSAILFGRLTDPEWTAPVHDPKIIAQELGVHPSLEYGNVEPLQCIPHLTAIYKRLADRSVESHRQRAENAIDYMMKAHLGTQFLDRLPLGVATPIREAARTCQMDPPVDWTVQAYEFIGRNDLAARVGNKPDMLFSDGYMKPKDYSKRSRRRVISEMTTEGRTLVIGETDKVSGVEIDLADFTSVRFGQDRRLEEVARMLCSSAVPNIKVLDRPELSELDQAKEHQHQVIRIAERTLALPYGRAMFTFASIPIVTREAFTIPKLEFSIKIQPLNITVAPEPGKIPSEYLHWGDFHNGVASALRISAASTGIESSWIEFNKPSELTPEHAGVLYGLGLTGHLKEMLTWHTFAYLTPKHDLTSIGVLLGLSAANIGTSNSHVMKLLAVHTPALLPAPSVDLNVSLMTQAAGLAGVGLLCMGTKNRRMAEVCLNQISRRDLVQPDLSNEYREAYTYAAALAFGMIMLGKGSSVPADMALLSRLSVLIHGDANVRLGMTTRPPFDINLTSPAATIALGLMYLKTERQDIADILTVPDTIIALNRIQPSFLLMRTLARALIMWNAISPTSEWLTAQVPKEITRAMEVRFQGKEIDDALELAYYNILSACCFAIGLKYAGTARQEAYMMIISYFDLFSKLLQQNGPAFDHKIKRSAVRDGLSLISISLSMVMTGTGELSCLRRFRIAYGQYQQATKYGTHVSTHISLGLLFLGGGRFTLGTSDAAIVCMITAFFPRLHQVSGDNKSYLQALRHLWVLAAEPRCLIARDVDANEVVYLPVKITLRDGAEVGAMQLISPSLVPDVDKLASIRVDTPRYWPFYLDLASFPAHRDSIIRCQTLYVKRRTAFLSYTEDPRGSRSLLVRSGSAAGDSIILDFPDLVDAAVSLGSDLSEFISSFSNDARFLAFADRFAIASKDDGNVTEEERVFASFCHGALFAAILQDKPHVLQSFLTLYRYRTMASTGTGAASAYFHLRVQDLRFAADFYAKLFDRKFGGRTTRGAVPRPPLLDESTVAGALGALDRQLNVLCGTAELEKALRAYANGEPVVDAQFSTVGSADVEMDDGDSSTRIATIPHSVSVSQALAWYLLRHCVPVSTFLLVLRDLAREARTQCLGPTTSVSGVAVGSTAAQPFELLDHAAEHSAASPDEEASTRTEDVAALEQGIRAVVHATGTKMAIAFGSGWSVRSLDDITRVWGDALS